MSRRAVVIVAVCVAIAVAPVCGFFGYIAYVEQLRVADATPAFEPLEQLGCRFWSQPVATYRYCHYVVEFPTSSTLSDESIGELNALKHLPKQNSLDLVIATDRVTDASLGVLKGIANLDGLDVTKSAISDAGIDQLKAALPDCEVFERR